MGETTILDLETDRKLAEIIDFLSNLKYEDFRDELGLLSGLGGVTSFLYWASRYKKSVELEERAGDILVYCIESASAKQLTFCDGVAGLCFLLLNLQENSFIDIEIDDVINDSDKLLARSLYCDLENHNIDFLHGAIGKGMYFLKRDTIDARHCVERLVLYLAEVIGAEPGEYGWKYFDFRNKTYDLNFSLSHGISSIIVFLCKVYKKGIEKNVCEEIIRKSIDTMLLYKSNNRSNRSVFPLYCDRGHVDARLAWCYGDLGIAVALSHVGEVFNDPTISELSQEILLYNTRRTTIEDSFIKDAMFCHGSSGVSYIYDKFSVGDHAKEFSVFSDVWLQWTLASADFKDGYANFKCFEKGSWQNGIGLLTGISGIGHVLLSRLDRDSSAWDEFFMIS